jgi:hypothetical protein
MIILNTKIRSYDQYDDSQRENENRLKETMEKIIIQEASAPAKKKVGGMINLIERRELPVVYTNPQNKAKKIKTFKLTI